MPSAHPAAPESAPPLWLVGLVCVAACSSSASPDTTARAAPPAEGGVRVVAVGDLHGDLDNAIGALQLAGITDAEGHWAGGDAVFVQTGDITDRGPDSKALIELMQRLEVEAAASGGRVVALLGNHEAMNLTGDWRYVHPGDVAAFGGETARRQALAVDGAYGRWLIERPVAAKVGETVFVHGGIRESFAKGGLDALNARARQALTGGSDRTVLGPDGPLWFRGYVALPEAEACGELDRALDALGAKRMVVGHTTRRDGKIQARCGGKLHVIDIGIADAYGSHLGAWVSTTGDARAIYPNLDVDLEDPA